jgi:DNA-binding response OmpR family regulator
MKTVLLTDDNEDIIELVKLILSKSGYNLKTAKGGQDALKVCAESPPDLVLMDLRMPDLDGFSATKQLRDSGYKNPIIILTGSESEDDRKQAFEAGCDDYILKTLEMRDLERSIDGFLQKGGSRL